MDIARKIPDMCAIPIDFRSRLETAQSSNRTTHIVNPRPVDSIQDVRHCNRPSIPAWTAQS